MRVFNRLIAVLVLAALFVAGLYAVIYGLNLLGYQIATLQQTLNLPGIYQGLRGFISGVEQGSLAPAGIAILIAIAVVGLILLILELKPRTPRRVRMEKGTYISRKAVSGQVEDAAANTRDVLGSSAKVKAKRRPGAQVKLRADVRRGEDQKQLRQAIRDSVQERLARTGIPLSKLKINLNESDPRQSKARVR